MVKGLQQGEQNKFLKTWTQPTIILHGSFGETSWENLKKIQTFKSN